MFLVPGHPSRFTFFQQLIILIINPLLLLKVIVFVISKVKVCRKKIIFLFEFIILIIISSFLKSLSIQIFDMKKLLVSICIIFNSVFVFAQAVNVTAAEAKNYTDQVITVCDKIVDAKYLESSMTKPTLLNVGGAYPNHILTIVINYEDRKNFPFNPEEFYLNKRVCITGKVTDFKGKPQIIVVTPAEIKVDASQAGASERSSSGTTSRNGAANQTNTTSPSNRSVSSNTPTNTTGPVSSSTNHSTTTTPSTASGSQTGTTNPATSTNRGTTTNPTTTSNSANTTNQIGSTNKIGATNPVTSTNHGTAANPTTSKTPANTTNQTGSTNQIGTTNPTISANGGTTTTSASRTNTTSPANNTNRSAADNKSSNGYSIEVGPNLRVRSGPGENFGVIEVTKAGSEVTVLGSENGWSHVTFEKESPVQGEVTTVDGYIKNSVLNSTTKPGTTNTTSATTDANNPTKKINAPDATKTVTGDANKKAAVNPKKADVYAIKVSTSLKVRSAPADNSDVMEVIKPGTVVSVIRSENGWSYVSYSGSSASGYAKNQTKNGYIKNSVLK